MQLSTGLLERIISKTGLLKSSADKERRQSRRYRLDMPIRFRICLNADPDTSSPYLEALLYDLSEHGIGLLTNTLQHNGFHVMDPTHDPSEPYRVEIEILCGKDPIRLWGKAVWYMPTPEGHSYAYRMGVQFIGLDAGQKKAVNGLIQLYHSGMGVS